MAVMLEHPAEGVVVVRVSGQVDTASAPVLSAVLHRQLDIGTARLLVVDLRAVDVLGGQGVAVLDLARQHADACHIRLCLLAEDRTVLRALQPGGTFEFCDDVDQLRIPPPTGGSP